MSLAGCSRQSILRSKLEWKNSRNSASLSIIEPDHDAIVDRSFENTDQVEPPTERLEMQAGIGRTVLRRRHVVASTEGVASQESQPSWMRSGS